MSNGNQDVTVVTPFRTTTVRIDGVHGKDNAVVGIGGVGEAVHAVEGTGCVVPIT